jgi:hypothetical protein
MGTPIFKICGEDVNVDQAIAVAIAGIVASGGSLSVANPALLSTLDNGPMTDGSYCWVTSNRVPFFLDKSSTLTADGISVVATLSGTGRWVRALDFHDQTWLAQVGWFINPATGNDTNAGTSAPASIKTIAEWYRRTGGQLTVDTIMFLQASVWPATDPFSYVTLPVGSNRTLSVVGVTTVVRSGTLTNSSNGNPVTNTANQITDGLISWAADVGKVIIFTSGPLSGKHVVILRDLGTGVARVSVVTDATGGVFSLPLIGTTYDVVTGTSIAFNGRALEGGTASTGAAFFVQDLDISNALRTWNYADTFHRCRLMAGNESRYAYGARFNGCSFLGGVGVSFTTLLPARFSIANSAVFIPINVVGLSVLNFQNSIAQSTPTVAATLSCGSLGTSSEANEQTGGNVSLTNASVTGIGAGCGFFDNTTGEAAVVVANGGLVRVGNISLYGKDNLKGLVARNGARIFIDSSYTPTLTGTIELFLADALTHMPKLPAGGPVPGNFALSTFSQWNLTPFFRTVTTQIENVGMYGTF